MPTATRTPTAPARVNPATRVARMMPAAWPIQIVARLPKWLSTSVPNPKAAKATNVASPMISAAISGTTRFQPLIFANPPPKSPVSPPLMATISPLKKVSETPSSKAGSRLLVTIASTKAERKERDGRRAATSTTNSHHRLPPT